VFEATAAVLVLKPKEKRGWQSEEPPNSFFSSDFKLKSERIVKRLKVDYINQQLIVRKCINKMQ